MMQPKQERTTGFCAVLYALAMFGCFPLCFHRFTDTSLVKLSAFLVVTAALGLFWLISLPRQRKKLPPKAFALVLFSAATGLSTALALNPHDAVWGYGGYHGGLVMQLGALAGYLMLSRSLPRAALLPLSRVFTGAGALVSLIGILNDFGVDPLRFYEGLDSSQYNIFFSTIGNVDYLCGFTCLWLALACWLWLASPEEPGRYYWLACAAIGFCGLGVLDSGLGSLGLMLAALVGLAVCPLPLNRLPRLWSLGLTAVAGLWLAEQLVRRLPHSLYARPMGVFGSNAAALCLGLPLVGLLAATKAALRRRPERGENTSLFLQRMLAGLALLLVELLMLLCTGLGLDLGALNNFFRLDALWATGRGAIFFNTLLVFRQQDALRRVIGSGFGSLHRLLRSTPLSDVVVDVYGAHNQLLDLLISCGLLGLLLWLAVLVLHLVPGLRRPWDDPLRFGWAMVCVAYLEQAMFTSDVCPVYPLLPLALGVLSAADRTEEQPDTLPLRLLLILAPLCTAACCLWGCVMLRGRGL